MRIATEPGTPYLQAGKKTNRKLSIEESPGTKAEQELFFLGPHAMLGPKRCSGSRAVSQSRGRSKLFLLLFRATQAGLPLKPYYGMARYSVRSGQLRKAGKAGAPLALFCYGATTGWHIPRAWLSLYLFLGGGLAQLSQGKRKNTYIS